ncbi:hypothetical protein HYPSUDRAFT_662448 [Hypholoma sublateritium FD-334 SS-4]|uniref:Uncharacterized protein n=1 Tax=Hypholoma sublateritium (strain FD-334 SS-4) TaxID=945553 RepID=A0A0D2NTX0_HYPSF|nr:hypothetical protein HYPSUDRAFT_662448 [Hypholoma sublateritium FD-334 SS-4]
MSLLSSPVAFSPAVSRVRLAGFLYPPFRSGESAPLSSTTSSTAHIYIYTPARTGVAVPQGAHRAFTAVLNPGEINSSGPIRALACLYAYNRGLFPRAFEGPFRGGAPCICAVRCLFYFSLACFPSDAAPTHRLRVSIFFRGAR